MSRPVRQQVFSVLVAALLVAGAVPVPATAGPLANGAAGDDVVSSQAAVGFLGGGLPSDTVRYGTDAIPSWTVSYDPEARGSLDAWANESSDRRIVSVNNDSGVALVVAPPGDIGASWRARNSPFSAGLAQKEWVTGLDVNQRVELDRPGPLLAANETSPPTPGEVTPGGWDQTGVAYSGDFNDSTLGDARDSLGVDGVSATGEGVRVAIIDTGLNVANGTSDPIYDDRIVAARNTITGEDGNASEDFEEVADGNGHGSWVAAAVAADAANDSFDGVAPDASLLIAKALDDEGSGSTQDIAEAIRWAERQDADIISMSLGSQTYSEALASALYDALEGNVTAAFIAAGNSRQTARFLASPSDVPLTGVLSVAATNTTSPDSAGSAYFSQVGPDTGRDGSGGTTAGVQLDVAAPGTTIAAPVYDGGLRRNSTLSGTSMATPLAAGVGALVLDANPGLENDTEAFVEQVRETASPVPGAGVTEVGHGMVNASRAVNDDPPETDQSEARRAPAQGRDTANRALSGSFYLKYIWRPTEAFGGLV